MGSSHPQPGYAASPASSNAQTTAARDFWDRCEQCGAVGQVTDHEEYGVICADCLEGFGPCSEEDLPQ